MMELKHAIAGLIIGLCLIVGFAMYKDFKSKGGTIPLFETTPAAH